MKSIPPNPYTDDPAVAPFAGRQAIFAALHHYLTAPAPTTAPVVAGWPGAGKTALLHQFDAMFDAHFFGVYLDVEALNTADQARWPRVAAVNCAAALVARDLSSNRLAPVPPIDADLDWPEWFATTFLPDMLRTLRTHRTLVLLLDNALSFDRRGPTDPIIYLHDLIAQVPALRLILTARVNEFTELDRLRPLVGVDDTHWLSVLDGDESAALMREPVAGLYTLDDSGVEAVFQATGGHPRLLQHYGHQLYRHWSSSPEHTTLTASTARQALPAVYRQSAAVLRARWELCSANEQRVLAALSHLMYADPLEPVTDDAVEAWLIESDYPLDRTAINAALRGLAWRGITTGTGNETRPIRAGLMQQWLLEHRPVGTAAPENRIARNPRLVVALALLVLIIALMLALLIGQTPASPATDPPPPTITLSGD